MTEPKEPRVFWLGISDTNIAHIDTKMKYASDYHLIEMWAYQALQSELEKVKAELEQLKKDHETVLKVGVDGQRKLNARQYEEYKIELAAEKAKSEKLVKALAQISSENKNDGNAPSDNTGPSSMPYWRWQELISRYTASDAIAAYKGMRNE